jgi:hypothetical protein
MLHAAANALRRAQLLAPSHLLRPTFKSMSSSIASTPPRRRLLGLLQAGRQAGSIGLSERQAWAQGDQVSAGSSALCTTAQDGAAYHCQVRKAASRAAGLQAAVQQCQRSMLAQSSTSPPASLHQCTAAAHLRDTMPSTFLNTSFMRRAKASGARSRASPSTYSSRCFSPSRTRSNAPAVKDRQRQAKGQRLQ